MGWETLDAVVLEPEGNQAREGRERAATGVTRELRVVVSVRWSSLSNSFFFCRSLLCMSSGHGRVCMSTGHGRVHMSTFCGCPLDAAASNGHPQNVDMWTRPCPVDMQTRPCPLDMHRSERQKKNEFESELQRTETTTRSSRVTPVAARSRPSRAWFPSGSRTTASSVSQPNGKTPTAREPATPSRSSTPRTTRSASPSTPSTRTSPSSTSARTTSSRQRSARSPRSSPRHCARSPTHQDSVALR